MEQTGTFVGKIIGAGTKLRTEHSTVGGSVTVLASYGAGLIVTADQKWVCDVADPAKLAEVGDTWIHVTDIGGINVVDGWMAVRYHESPIVILTVDQPDIISPPPIDTVTNSVTVDYDVTGDVVAVWVNGTEFTRTPPPAPPVG